jgi:UDP-N-acetylglucosamine 2-epimerase
MPEEHNRVVADHCADILFCPTQTAVENLACEGIRQAVHLVGDTMLDAVLHFTKIGEKKSVILKTLNLHAKEYVLATVHRPYNTDKHENLISILNAFRQLPWPVIFPVHPRTRNKLYEFGIDQDIENPNSNLQLINPVGYLDMLVLEKNAQLIMTDSGGIQKEAFFFKVPCITLRPETEWLETVDYGWNILTGADSAKIVQTATGTSWPSESENLFGDGNAAEKIVSILS